MKKILRHVLGKRHESRPDLPAGDIELSIFGKHPGWDDHMPGVGLEQPSAAAFKQALYLEGIGGLIDSGAWEKLQAGSRLAGFDHQFLVLDGEQALMGQLWSSRDGKGRSSYPLVAVASTRTLTPETLLLRTSAELGALRTRLEKSGSADQLLAAWRSSCFTLRLPPTSGGINRILSDDWKERFLALPALGPDRVGLERSLHELAVGMDLDGAAKGGRNRRSFKPFFVRVPCIAGNSAESLLMWATFLRIPVPAQVPLALFARSELDWLDAIVGSPMAERLFCLQAGIAAVPVSSTVDYNLIPRTRAWADQCVRQFLEQRPSSKTTKESVPRAFRDHLPAETHEAAPVANRKGGWLLAAAGLVVLVGIAWWFVPPPPPPPPQQWTLQLAQLSTWVENHDYLRALSPTNQWPDDPEFRSLLRQADRGRSQHHRKAIQEATEALDAEDFDRALAHVQEATRWQVAQEAEIAQTLSEAITHRQGLWQEREDERKRDELARDQLVASWETDLRQMNFASVMAGVAGLPEGWIDDPRIAGLVQQAHDLHHTQQQQAALELVERNRTLEEWKRRLDQGDYQFILDQADDVNARWPEAGDFAELQKRAVQEKERAEQLVAARAARKQAYDRADQALVRGDYELALSSLNHLRTENSMDSLDFDALRADIETEQALLRQVQQPDTDLFTLLAWADLPDKAPFQTTRTEARNRALAQVDDWLAEDRFQEILDRLKDQPYASEDEFARRLHVPRVWKLMVEAREEDQKDEVRRLLEELAEEDQEREPIQELASWAKETPEPVILDVARVVDPIPPPEPAMSNEWITRVNRLLRSYEVQLGVGDAPRQETINGNTYRRLNNPGNDFLEEANRRVSSLDRQPITDDQRERMRILREEISRHKNRLAGHRGL
jgi:hypothetical protein